MDPTLDLAAKMLNIARGLDTPWKKEICKSFPQQLDGTSCGVFVLALMKAIAEDENPEKLEFSQKEVPEFRKQVAREFIKQKIQETN